MHRNIASNDEFADEMDTFRTSDAEANLIIREDKLLKKSSDRYFLIHNTYHKWYLDHKYDLSRCQRKTAYISS